MTKEEIKALINAKITGQGNEIDAGSVLPSILGAIIDLAGEGGGGGGGGDDPDIPTVTEEVTYAELVELRNSGTLMAGHKYRITDYVTKVYSYYGEEVPFQSAEHPFDLIVTATGSNTLSEDAEAALHEGDTYFARCNLSKWKIKYILDNDSNQAGWADRENGKGVIISMTDEYNNTCPYDFKNIMFARVEITSLGDPFFYLEGSFLGTKAWWLNGKGANEYDIAIGSTNKFYYTFSTFLAEEEGELPYEDTPILDATVLQAESPYPSVENNTLSEDWDHIPDPEDPEEWIESTRVLNNTVLVTSHFIEENRETGDPELYIESCYDNQLTNAVSCTLVYCSNTSLGEGSARPYASLLFYCFGATFNPLGSGNTICASGTNFKASVNTSVGVFSNCIFNVTVNRLFAFADYPGLTSCASHASLTETVIQHPLKNCVFMGETYYLDISGFSLSGEIEKVVFWTLMSKNATHINMVFTEATNKGTRFASVDSDGGIQIWNPADTANSGGGGGDIVA